MNSKLPALLHRTAGEVAHSCRIKRYPDGQIEIMAAERPIFKPRDWEPCDGSEDRRRNTGSGLDLERSRHRAITRIRDYALCSDFEWFVTLTLDGQQIDRYDYETVIKKLGNYCSNRVQRQGLRYVLVTELHKDGALHFHGFMAGLPDAEFHPSGTYTGGIAAGKPRRPRDAGELARWTESGAHEVFNLTSWKYGFTTAVRLESDYKAAISYITKYIRKAENKVGGRWYLSGGDLKLPEITYWDIPISTVQAMDGAFSFAAPGNGFSVWRGRADEAGPLLQ